MLLIKSIDYEVLPEGQDITVWAEEQTALMSPGEENWDRMRELQHTVVRGRRFVSPSGTEFILAVSPSVEKTLGFSFAMFDDLRESKERQERQIDNLKGEVAALKQKKSAYRSVAAACQDMTWKERLAFLFKGRNYPKVQLPKV